MNRRSKAVAWLVFCLGMIVLLVAGIQLFFPLAREQYFIWMLNSEDEKERRAAVERLGEIGSARVMPYLFRAVKKIWSDTSTPQSVIRDGEVIRFSSSDVDGDGDLDLFIHNAELNAALFNGVFFSLDRRFFYWPADGTCFEALTEITRRAGRSAVRHLVAELDSEHSYIRCAAASLLGQLGLEASAAIAALKRLTRKDDQHLRAVAEDALKKIQGDAADGESTDPNTLPVEATP